MEFLRFVILFSAAAGQLALSQSLPATAEAMETFVPSHQVIPLPNNEVTFQERGLEKTRWHYDSRYPRPFFYPFNGPSGETLTRMGHPGAPDHDHHRSIWFAHNKVNGLNFWADAGLALPSAHPQPQHQIKQKQWLAYHDGETEAIMATLLGWFVAEGTEQMEQELIAALLPMAGGECALEIQTTFRTPKNATKVELEQTNFGLLAVRVAKSISEVFGGGTLTSSEGLVKEKNIFGNPAKWIDYSGPIATGQGETRRVVEEGITFFDHPGNPRYPTHWHVRGDGWMGASFCMKESFTITPEAPLVLRYLLHSHSGKYDPKKAEAVAELFAKRPDFALTPRPRPHLSFGVGRIQK